MNTVVYWFTFYAVNLSVQNGILKNKMVNLSVQNGILIKTCNKKYLWKVNEELVVVDLLRVANILFIYKSALAFYTIK